MTPDPFAHLPRYSRAFETVAAAATPVAPLSPAAADAAIVAADLTPGGRALLGALVRVARARVFPGGGVGLDYGPLLKSAIRPDVVGAHVREAAADLRGVDLLLAPGNSGHPIAGQYAAASGVPALLLRKDALAVADVAHAGPGSFVIASYTGSGDTLISPDLAAARDIVAGVVARQVAAQAGAPALWLTLRVSGVDDIVDKGVMVRALADAAGALGAALLAEAVADLRADGEQRPVTTAVAFDAMLAPLRRLAPGGAALPAPVHAGVEIAAVQVSPPAILVAGVGWLPLRAD
jgi:hypothetical protein